MREYLIKLIKEYPNQYSYLIDEEVEKDRIKNLEGFEKYGLSGICSNFCVWCENWPETIADYFEYDTNKHVDKEDLDPNKVYYVFFEELDIENFEAEIKTDENGEEYIDVEYAGGDWQDSHSFQIYKNPDNEEKPLICKNIINLDGPFQNIDSLKIYKNHD